VLIENSDMTKKNKMKKTKCNVTVGSFHMNNIRSFLSPSAQKLKTTCACLATSKINWTPVKSSFGRGKSRWGRKRNPTLIFLNIFGIEKIKFSNLLYSFQVIQRQLKQNKAQKDGHKNFLVNAVHHNAESTQTSNRILPDKEVVNAS
jgi:hypothetical protein